MCKYVFSHITYFHEKNSTKSTIKLFLIFQVQFTILNWTILFEMSCYVFLYEVAQKLVNRLFSFEINIANNNFSESKYYTAISLD